MEKLTDHESGSIFKKSISAAARLNSGIFQQVGLPGGEKSITLPEEKRARQVFYGKTAERRENNGLLKTMRK